eukprot:5970012-Lingulodinium_polyedra.AAC.1
MASRATTSGHTGDAIRQTKPLDTRGTNCRANQIRARAPDNANRANDKLWHTPWPWKTKKNMANQ